jgi:FkbM family methyltransferase
MTREVHASEQIPGAVIIAEWRNRGFTDTPVIVELGAHNGQTLRELTALFPAFSAYIGADADPRNAEPLALTVRGLAPDIARRVITRCPAAVVSPERAEAGFIALHSSEHGSRPLGSWTYSSSTLPPTTHLSRFPAIYFKQDQRVQAMSFDDLCGSLQPDLVWMDIEGAEREVCESMTCLPGVKAIVMEAWTEPLHAGAWSRAQAIAWTAARGFRLIAESDQDIFVAR